MGKIATLKGTAGTDGTNGMNAVQAYCMADMVGSQTIVKLTATPLTFNTSVADSNSFHSTTTNTSRFTIPSGLAGLYDITAFCSWASSTSGERYLFVCKNGVYTTALPGLFAHAASVAVAGWTQIVEGFLQLSVGDFVEAVVWQTATGSIGCGSVSTIPATPGDFNYLSLVKIG